MRSDQLIKRLRRSAWIGDVAAWPDITDADLLDEMNDRYLALISDEIIVKRAGYGLRELPFTTTIGLQRYPVPDRAIGGAWDTLFRLLPDGKTWFPLSRVESRDIWQYDRGPTDVGIPAAYSVQDGNIEVYRSPNSATQLKYLYYIRPSYLVTSQSSTQGGDNVDRGRITVVNTGARTVTVNALPFDQLLSPPAPISTAVQPIDIVRPKGTFPCTMTSVTQSFTGLVFTLGGTQDMSDVAVGDYVRVAEQTDWPSNLPVEFHRMIADRAAMEVLREIGLEEKEQVLALTVKADLDRFRRTCVPQVKSQPKMLPCVPFLSRGRRRSWWNQQ